MCRCCAACSEEINSHGLTKPSGPALVLSGRPRRQPLCFAYLCMLRLLLCSRPSTTVTTVSTCERARPVFLAQTRAHVFALLPCHALRQTADFL